jgi:hypothetical protein
MLVRVETRHALSVLKRITLLITGRYVGWGRDRACPVCTIIDKNSFRRNVGQ